MEYFLKSPQGVVVSMDTESSELLFSVWFDYTKTNMRTVKVGSFIAVKNFNSDNGETRYSILEIVSAFPRHYALGSNPRETERAFPGFVVEAARNAKLDWEQEEAIEQTTKIKADAISTGLQLIISNGESKLDIEDSLPMTGEDAHLLTDEQINNIVNRGLLDGSVKTITMGNLILNKDVKINISTEDMLKTHFGIFGFTGAGKSNLLSNIISGLCCNSEPNKLILFDLMTEYTGLLIDLLDKLDDGYLICLSEDSLPGSEATARYLRGDASQLDAAVKSIVATMLLPKELMPFKEKFVPKVKEMLEKGKVKVYNPGSAQPTVGELRAKLESMCEKGLYGATNYVRKIVEYHLSGQSNKPVDIEVVEALANDLRQGISVGKVKDYTSLESNGGQQALTEGPALEPTIDLSNSAKGKMIAICDVVSTYLDDDEEEPLPENVTLSINDLHNIVSNKEKPALLVFQSNRDDDIRFFSNDLVTFLFDRRRVQGKIYPHVSFIYDEADEFIPGTAAKDTSYASSKNGATLLARRGRKFGLGLGIATQRVAYLDTSIIAQPHTFFLSKLPREYDRGVIGSAFGTSDEMINRTLTFQTGQWLLFSYDATGLTNVPIPAQLPNANDRIKEFLG